MSGRDRIMHDDDALIEALREAVDEAGGVAAVAAAGHQVRVPDGTEGEA